MGWVGFQKKAVSRSDLTSSKELAGRTPPGKDSAMRNRNLPFLFGIILTLVFGTNLSPAAAPSYAISATNVTMPSSGGTSSPYTVTQVQFTGTLVVTCQYSGPTTVARIPTCYAPPVALAVTAGQSYTGAVTLDPWGVPIPVGARRPGRWPLGGLALTGALVLGIGLRRRRSGPMAMMVLALGLMAMGACSASPSNGMTPGTYVYTISADNESGGVTPLGVAATTTIQVTVP